MSPQRFRGGLKCNIFPNFKTFLREGGWDIHPYAIYLFYQHCGCTSINRPIKFIVVLLLFFLYVCPYHWLDFSKRFFTIGLAVFTDNPSYLGINYLHIVTNTLQ